MSVRAETEEEAYDNESANNTRKSEAKNVAHVVARDASSRRPRGLNSGCRMFAYRNIASMRARASTSASVHAGWITRKAARRRMGRSGVSG